MLSHRVLLLLSCLCFVLCVHAQDELSRKIDSISNLKVVDDKIEGFQKTLKEQDTTIHTESLGTLYHKLATCYYKQKAYDKALPLYLEEVAIRSKFKDKFAYNKSRYYVSRIYANTKRFEEEYALLIEIIYDLGDDLYTSYAHRVLGRNERERGNIPQSLHYLNLGLANKKLCKNISIESNLRYEIITTYAKKYESTFKIDDTNSDLKIIQKHEKLIQLDEIDKVNRAVLNNALAVIYDAFKDYNKSLFFYK